MMKNENDISKELATIGSPLAGMSHAMPYDVPDGYFETLCYHIEQCVAASEGADPSFDIGKEMPLKVPDRYFQFLPQQMLAAAIDSEPVLDTSRTMPFSIPEKYFELLPGQMLTAAKEAAAPLYTKKKKTITLKRQYIFNQVRLAVAAMLILGIGFGSIKYYMHAETPENALAQVPTPVISEYVNQHIDDFDTDMIVNNMDANTLNAEAASIDANNIDIQSQTKKLNDEDIIQYLNETGWDQSANSL